MKKHILILNTGGTISSILTPQGYQPAPGYVQATLPQIAALKQQEMPHYTIKEYQPLLDSANFTVKEWNRIAQDIVESYDDYDGFVIFHGTDTMAYTASALSFMLENLDKPIILTGSQIPLSVVRSDAIDNIQTSLWLCAHRPINEVCIYFNQCLLRGNRAQKVYEQQLNAFDSPNYPHLATIGIQIQLHDNYLLAKPTMPLHYQPIQSHLISNLRLFPGFDIELLAHCLQQPLRALILQTYGAGNAPNHDPRLLALLSEAIERKMLIINATQCQRGSVKMQQYATGFSLKQTGLISAHDMTIETVHCKLLYLFSKYTDNLQIKHAMTQNLRGELTTQLL